MLEGQQDCISLPRNVHFTRVSEEKQTKKEGKLWKCKCMNFIGQQDSYFYE